jgi:hypothetical protein
MKDELLERIDERLEAHSRVVTGVQAYHALAMTQELITGLRRTIAGWKQLDTHAIAKAAKAGMEKTAAFQKYQAGGYSLMAREMKQLNELCKQIPFFLENRPGELDRALNGILNRTAEQFDGWSVQSMANGDRDAFAGLLDSYPISVQEIEARLKYIEELKGRMLEHERGGGAPSLPSSATTIPLPAHDGPGDEFPDPRLP